MYIHVMRWNENQKRKLLKKENYKSLIKIKNKNVWDSQKCWKLLK